MFVPTLDATQSFTPSFQNRFGGKPNYDEHVVVNNYKFGLIYQRYGQVTEESLFGNRSHSTAMDQFLDMLGQRIDLSQHNGYKGGLDTVHGQVQLNIHP